MPQFRLALLSLLCPALGLAQSAGAPPDTGWQVRAIDTLPRGKDWSFSLRTIRFHNGHRLTIVLDDLEVLASLPRGHRAPALVLAGRECGACDAETRVYLVPADQDSVDPRSHSYSFPGTHQPGGEPDSTIYYRGRLFLGRCTGSEPQALWFQSERDSTGQWHHSAYRVPLATDSLAEGYETARPPIGAILEHVRRAECHEVPGRKQYTY